MENDLSTQRKESESNIVKNVSNENELQLPADLTEFSERKSSVRKALNLIDKSEESVKRISSESKSLANNDVISDLNEEKTYIIKNISGETHFFETTELTEKKSVEEAFSSSSDDGGVSARLSNKIYSLHDEVYPDIKLLSVPPFPLDFYRKHHDEELEDWASLPIRKREVIKGTLNILLLKKGLSNFSYESYGFTRLCLSNFCLIDISLFLHLPMTFNALTYVDLSHNMLTDISPLAALSTITHLDVSHNKLKRILFMYPEFYWNVDEPELLNMNGNVSKSLSQISSRGWSLCGPSLSRLRWVNFSYNLVTHLEGPKHWVHYPYINYLDLSHNRISDLKSENPNFIPTDKQTGDEYGTDDTQYGLAKLMLLHTLDLSYNYISHVEKFNELHVHKLILSHNAISSWEGETGPLYEDDHLKWLLEQEISDNISDRSNSGLDQSNGPEENQKPEKIVSELSMQQSSNQTIDTITSVENEFPDFHVLRKRHIELKEEEVDSNREIETKYTNLLEFLYPTEYDQNPEVSPAEVLYDSRQRKIDNNFPKDLSSSNVSVMGSWLNEENIFKNWYDTDVKVLYSPGRYVNWEDEEDKSESSFESVVFGEREVAEISEILPSPDNETDDLSLSEMFDYEWEGYQPDDQCFAKVRRGVKVPSKSSTNETKVEVLYERSDIVENVESEDLDEDEDRVKETIYEEWDDPKVHELYRRKSEDDGESDLDDRSIEWSQVKTETKHNKSAGVDVLFEKTSDNEGIYFTDFELKEKQDSEKEMLKVIYIRDESKQEERIEKEDAHKCRSLEVLFSRSNASDASTTEDGKEIQVENNLDENNKPCVPLGDHEICFDAYEKTSVSLEEESGVNVMDSDSTESSNTCIDAGGDGGFPIPRKSVGVYKRIDANVFKEYVGFRSLQWLAELHLEHNKITSLKMFRGMYCLRSLFIQYNQIEDIGELIFLSDLHRLICLDMTGNPVTKHERFTETVLFLHPSIGRLNDVDCSTYPRHMRREPTKLYCRNPFFRAARQTNDLILASELCRDNYESWSCPEVISFLMSNSSILLLVGPECSGNIELCYMLLETLPGKTHLSLVYTTKPCEVQERNVSKPKEDSENRQGQRSVIENLKPPYRFVTEIEFNRLMFSGRLVSVSENEGYLFGLEKYDILNAVIQRKITIAAVDLTTALSLRISRFGRGIRLVLVLPESITVHEKSLRRKFRLENKMCPVRKLSTDVICSSTDVERRYEAEQQFVRRNLEAREEYLITHQQNPGIFEFGVFSDNKESAIEKIKSLVDNIYDNLKSLECFNESNWYKEEVSEYIMSKINTRFEMELNNCLSMWE